MPQLHVRIKKAQEVWKSPDGQRVIYSLIMSVPGVDKDVGAKTYSKAIATDGWEGDIESYEKPGKNGPETFVKQIPKEGGFQRQPKDEAAIKSMWSIGQAVNYIATTGGNFDDIEAMATDFFAMVDRVKSGIPIPEKPDVVYEVDEEPLDLSGIKGVFGVE